MFNTHLSPIDSILAALTRCARSTVMVAASLGLICSLFSIPNAFADPEVGTFEQTVSGVAQDATVHVTTASGDVNIRPGDDGEVRVIAHVTIDPNVWALPYPSPAQAIERLQQNPPVSQDGSDVRIGYISDTDLQQNISISYEIKVPITAKLKVRIGSGSADIHQIDNEVDASTSSGHVTVTDIQGAVRASAKSGAVDVRSITDTATVSVGSGPVNGYDLAAPKVKAESGTVVFGDVHGSCDVTVNSGDIKVDGDPSAPWSLHSDSGAVSVTVNQPANFELNAQAPSGDIHNSLQFSKPGDTSSGQVSGSVGDGGPAVDLSTSAGDISIE